MKLLESKVVLLNRDKIKSRFIYHGVKRVFDFLAAACGIIILSPLMLIIAVLIKSEDHGPVFYKQKRIGQNGKAFEMYKFRSMFVNAGQMLAKLKEQNDVDGPMFKMKDDPRVTKIGHFIRKHSLDELPQFLNILRGDMSLVGPRPPLPSEVEEYSEYDKQRLFVIPGCTGLWQATERNEVGFNEMVQLDIEYIQRAGFLFDLWIMVKTVGIVIKPNGSY
uniref:Putative glycosyltransferase n=1 Tax=Limosilactobacillus fermentum TaxID=1613 RepID=D2KXE3_LIMFE|nr:putative glycosyltransferase [Limosilactobacillus fermentum]